MRGVALPFAVALFAGAAQADNGAGAGVSSNAAVAEILGGPPHVPVTRRVQRPSGSGPSAHGGGPEVG
ncbi:MULTISPECIES: hypothetical protein [unclassified Streptomyces]|uniref:hypothetical protein n=1 Tax=unclassified Streptomyces TaxID=2593676 RepID=UPI002258D3EB|nr:MULTISPECIES: hypothetical protein [unclassified Streptomyces]MCX5145267.1 hypothetical protein [Streptomyces sp. NBC_00320]WSN53953.1 hypothetical protein OG299_13225 [Streptomyces sp. NBC_01296]